jgi:hypothetical protein
LKTSCPASLGNRKIYIKSSYIFYLYLKLFGLATSALAVLALAVLAFSPAWVSAAPMTNPAITAADLTHVSDSTLLSFDFPDATPYKVFTLSQPNRIVIDIHAADKGHKLTALAQQLAKDDATIANIRLGKPLPHVSRIVLDIKSALPELQTRLRSIGNASQRLTLHWHSPQHSHKPARPTLQTPQAAPSKPNEPIQQALDQLEDHYMQPATQPPANAAEIRFTCHAIELSGNTLFSSAQLAPLWQNQLGKQIALLDIYAIARAITERYHADGYVLSIAEVPAQKIIAGKVRLNIIEGQINEVSVQDAEGKILKTESQRLTAALKQKPMQIKQLEHILSQNHSGTIARAYFKPSAQRGITALNVVLTRVSPRVSTHPR